MTGITWLHLSDWHESSNRDRFDRGVVLEKLIEDIKAREKLNPNLSQINFIIFSGDVAFSGQSGQYSQAWDKFFQKILDATGLKSKQLFIIPGNHDINRDTLNDPNFQKQFSLPLDRSKVSNWLSDGSKRTNFLKPFTEFKQFAEEYLKYQQEPVYASTLKFENIQNKRVALLGLNSALMSGRNKDSQGKISDQGILFVGEHQILTGLQKIQDYDVKIAVLHHPREWLVDFDRTSFDRHLRDFDFVLCGHRHISQTIHLRGIGGRCSIIAAGASYSSRDYSNGYNFVHYDPDSRRVKIYLRRWEDELGQWINAPFLDDTGKVVYEGCYEFPPPIPISIKPLPKPPKIGEENYSQEKRIEELKEHYDEVAQKIKEGTVVPVLGADINFCGRGSHGNPWDWELTGGNSPTNLEIAAYIESQFEEIATIGCPFCDDPPSLPSGFPPGCPLNTKQVARLDLPYLSQYFWSRGKQHLTDRERLRRAINDIYDQSFYHSSVLGKSRLLELSGRLKKH